MTENWDKREERRKHVRLKKDIPVTVSFSHTTKNLPSSPPQAASILNISASGVCVELEGLNEDWKEDLLFGRLIIILEVNLPEEEKAIKVLARAVWITKVDNQEEEKDKAVKFLMGARFVEITSQQEDAITQYIIKHFL